MISVIEPVSYAPIEEVEKYLYSYFPGDELEVITIEDTPNTIENFTQKTLASAKLLQNLDLFKLSSALIVNCFADPCLFELRENLNIPVFGAGETSMHIASLLGEFAVIGPGDNLVSWTRLQAREYGVFDKLISAKEIKYSVKDIIDGESQLYNATKQACIECIAEHADVVVLGCTGFSSISDKLKKEIWNEYKVPVLEPLLTTYSVARSLGLVVNHGRKGLFSAI